MNTPNTSFHSKSTLLHTNIPLTYIQHHHNQQLANVPPNKEKHSHIHPPTPFPEEKAPEFHFFNSVLAGGIAGLVSKSICAPIDRVKIMYQVYGRKFYFKDAWEQGKALAKLNGKFFLGRDDWMS